MKSLFRSALALTCLSSVAWMPAAHAEFKCNQQYLYRVDKMACAKAAEGPEALRRFVSNTQRIYGLQMIDYVQLEWDFPSKEPSKMARSDAQESRTDLAAAAPVR